MSSRSSDASTVQPIFSMTRIKRQLYILVVDDSTLNRRMIIKLLNDHVCDQADDGDVAVAMYERNVAASIFPQPASDCDTSAPKIYDAILMDFMMPKMDGPTATEIIREMGYTGLVIGITGMFVQQNIF